MKEKNLEENQQQANVQNGTSTDNDGSLISVIKKSFESFGAAAGSKKDEAPAAKGVDESGAACNCPPEGGGQEGADKSTSKDYTEQGSEIIGIPDEEAGAGEINVESEPRQLTIEEIEKMKEAEAGGEDDGGYGEPIYIDYGQPIGETSVPRNFNISNEFERVERIQIPPIFNIVEPPAPPPHVCIPSDPKDDCNIVFEKGLGDCECDDKGKTIACGNILQNDVLGDSFLCSITFNGCEYKPDQNGVITVDTPAGLLLVYTTDYGNHKAGDYVYTLEDAINHPYDKGKNIVNEEFTYKLCNDCGDISSAKLTIKIVDDVPKANDDCTAIVHENLPCSPCKEKVSGNVLNNDCKGADTPVRVVSFTYNCGADKAIIPQSYGVTSTTVITDHGGKLTVYSNGYWCYEAPVDKNPCKDGAFHDDFTYTIKDHDGDKSSATQPILVLDAPEQKKPEANDDCNIVFESGLACGSDKSKPTCAQGNVLDNDQAKGASITSLCFDGKTYTPVNGVITVDAGVGTLVLYTECKNGHEAGDYKYTLNENAEHPCEDGKNKIEQEFTYKLSEDCGCASDKGTLTIKIVDDVPKAVDDCKVTVHENLPCSPCKEKVEGNVLANDVKGADKPVRVISFTYDNGAKCATIEEGCSTTVKTAFGGLLTVGSNGDWSYIPHVTPEGKCETDAPFCDDFTYTIQDGDCDTSCATQSIYVIDEIKPIECDPKPPCEEQPPVCAPNPPCDDKPPVCEPKPPCEEKPPCETKPPVCEPEPPVCEPKPPVCEPKPPVCEPKPPVCDDKPRYHEEKCDDKPPRDDKCDDKPKQDDKCKVVCDDKDERKDDCDKDKGYKDNRHDKECEPTCGNVIKDVYEDCKGLSVAGFKYHDQNNKLCSAKCGELVTTYSGAKFSMEKDGSYKHVQQDNSKSFSDKISYTIKGGKGFSEKSSFSIHTNDIDAKEDHGRDKDHRKGDKGDYIVDISDIAPKHSLSMKELGLNHKLDNLPGSDNNNHKDHPGLDVLGGFSAKSANDNNHANSHGLPLVAVEHGGAQLEQQFAQVNHETHVVK